MDGRSCDRIRRKRLAGHILLASVGVYPFAFACATYEQYGQTIGSVGGATTGTNAHQGGSTGGGRGGISGSVPSGGVPTSGAPSDVMSAAGSGIGAGSSGVAGIAAGAGGATFPSGDAGAGGDSNSMNPISGCPEDANKLLPGGPTPPLSDCDRLKTLLIHRYDFEGGGSFVTDRVGIAHGMVVQGALSTLDGKGVVQMSGGATGAYVDLPNGLLSSLTSASLEAWVTWGGGDLWQRIFDFGDSTSATPENNPKDGRSYLYVTPQSVDALALVGYSLAGSAGKQFVKASTQLPRSLCQVVAVADAAGETLSLYINGAKVAEQSWAGSLSEINDVNVWLGRSQYAADARFNGVFHDFRVYGGALTATLVALSYQGGSDPAFLR